MTITIEGVGNEVEAGEARQLIEGPRGHATDRVPVQREALEVVEATEHCSVHR